MKTLTLEEEVTLLQKVHRAGAIETFIHFPEIIISGEEKLEREDLDYLLDKGYLVEKKRDSFGSIFCLSPSGEQSILKVSSHHKKSKEKQQHPADFAF